MPRPTPIAVKEADAAYMFGLKPAQFRGLVECGAMPSPVNVHGFLRWRVADLEAVLNGEAASEEFVV